MQLVATIAVVFSVLVLAYQARQLSGNTQVANEVAGTQAHREIVFHWNAVIAPVFIERPELYAHYFDETTAVPTPDDQVRLKVLADQIASWLEMGLVTSGQLRSYVHGIGDWPSYAADALASTPALRSIVRSNPGLWPPLDPILARYDAANDLAAERPPAAPGDDGPAAPDPDQE